MAICANCGFCARSVLPIIFHVATKFFSFFEIRKGADRRRGQKAIGTESSQDAVFFFLTLLPPLDLEQSKSLNVLDGTNEILALFPASTLVPP